MCSTFIRFQYSFFQSNHGSIVGFPGAEPTEDNLLTAQCDILVPAAGEKQITADIAHQMKAKVCLTLINPVIMIHFKVIAEGANGPTTIAAEKILHGKNVLVIPVSL